MAPEQSQGRDVDRRSDIYAFGVVAYEVLTGTLPVGRFRVPSKIHEKVPRWLDAMVIKALDSVPEKRFDSVAPMLQLIDRKSNSRNAL